MASLQKVGETHKRILHPRDLSSGTQRGVRQLTQSRHATIRAPQPSTNVTDGSPPVHSQRGRTVRAPTPRIESSVERFNDSENEDYSDAFDDRAPALGRSTIKLELTKKLSSKSWVRSISLLPMAS